MTTCTCCRNRSFHFHFLFLFVLLLVATNKSSQDEIQSSVSLSSNTNTETYKIGNTKTKNYNLNESNYLPTQLTQVVLNVPKFKKKLRRTRPPTVEELAVKSKIMQIYEEARSEPKKFEQLGRILMAMNPKYVATFRVYDVVFENEPNHHRRHQPDPIPIPSILIDELPAMTPEQVPSDTANTPPSEELGEAETETEIREGEEAVGEETDASDAVGAEEEETAASLGSEISELYAKPAARSPEQAFPAAEIRRSANNDLPSPDFLSIELPSSLVQQPVTNAPLTGYGSRQQQQQADRQPFVQSWPPPSIRPNQYYPQQGQRTKKAPQSKINMPKRKQTNLFRLNSFRDRFPPQQQQQQQRLQYTMLDQQQQTPNQRVYLRY